MSSLSLMDEVSKAEDPAFDAETKTVSFWGFAHCGVPPKRVAVGEMLKLGDCCLLRVTESVYIVAPTRSLQVVGYGSVQTISHRFLSDTDFHAAIEAKLREFAGRIGVQFVEPKWRIVTGRVKEGVL